MEEIRIGVYICHCGTNIAGVIDVGEVAEFAKSLEGVFLVRDMMYACSLPSQQKITQDIKEYGLNRVVVAACSPRMHEQTFQAVCEGGGLNKYLFEMANIREQASWVHDGGEATGKAKDLVKMALAKAKLLKPYKDTEIQVGSRSLVIGGGIAGIQAALDLADSGYKVYLVEREPFIGGRMAQLDKTFPTLDCSTCILAPKMSEVERHQNIELMTNSEVVEVSGHVGNFTVTIIQRSRFVSPECTSCSDCVEVCPVAVPDGFNIGLSQRKAIYKSFPQAVPATYAIDFNACMNEENLITCERCIEVCEVGAINFDVPPKRNIKLDVDTIIIATGTDPYDPSQIKEYRYGYAPNVITTLDLERIISPTGPSLGRLIRPSDFKPPKSIAFIQCVGSRNLGQLPYCSGICCMVTIKHALLTAEKIPNAAISVYYIDIRAKGKGFEEMYRRARMQGVHFIKGIPSEIVEEEDGSLTLIGENILLGEIYQHNFDMVVLSVGLKSREGSEDIGRLFNLSQDIEGFFIEKHPKLEPVDTAITGVFLAGACESPKDIRESSIQAKAAASRASRLMKEGVIKVEALFGRVSEERCAQCHICEPICPFGAISLDGVAKVSEASCQGCGTCAPSCPSSAITMQHFTDEGVLAQIEAALEEGPHQKVIVFTCNWCSYGGADMAGTSRMKYSPQTRIIRLPCSGRVDPSFVLRALEMGAGGVLITGCHPGECHYQDGNLKALRRYKLLKTILCQMGVEEGRVRLEWVSAAEGEKFTQLVNDFVALAIG